MTAQHFPFRPTVLLCLTCLILGGRLSTATSQTLQIQPYLQDARPDAISILWETDAGEESLVQWGLSETLGNETFGTAYTSNGTALVHEVQLEGLERFTQYFYRVVTDTAVSAVYSFKTPPFASDHEPFRIVAMSDMQRDGNFPDKFQEIVEEGVLNYLETTLGNALTDNLALVMIPGDLVDNGNNYDQWRNTFFNPAEQLFSQVPVYPVLGNHENNSAYYFTYFKLPENGTPGFEEHWWFKDYGNVRIIGLNSNGAFAIPEQLDWLDATLNATCAADSIDFVFAQLHHPHKSELWTPGESDFTGEVIRRMEQFSTDCGKPSIHLFGHTHGYSRGQSRDHKHLWINVATAGGAIDNWGEFPNFDYDEFSVSQDEYGFVLVEISDDPEPAVTIKRIGRGDQDAIEENVLRDQVTIRLADLEVYTPEPLFPLNEEIAPECVTLEAAAFSAAAPTAEHGQSHWQVTTFENGFNEPVYERWRNFENWYFDVDTQAEDDLTDERVDGLAAWTTYLWRVRYRDKEMNWSDWSAPATFSTGASIALPNLLLNPAAEQDLSHWTIVEGVVEALESGVCNGIPPHSGNKYFAVGGLCEHSPVGRAVQNVEVSAYADSIDTGVFPAHFGGYLSNYSGADLPEMKLLFLDADALVIGESPVLSTLNNSWTLLAAEALIPSQTRFIQIELKGTRNQGTDNDCYFDDLFLTLGTDSLDCGMLPLNVQAHPLQLPRLQIAPNPASEEVLLRLPTGLTGNWTVAATDSAGNKMAPIYRQEGNALSFSVASWPAGTYMLWLRGKQGLLAVGKVVVVR